MEAQSPDSYTPKFLPTFIPGLPECIFIGGRNYLVSGRPGTGKSCFCYTFMEDGFEKGENAIYMTFDQKTENVLIDAMSFGIDLAKQYKEGRLAIIEGAEYMGKAKSDTSTGQWIELSIKDMMNDVKKKIKELSAKRLVLDPIAPVLTPSFVTPVHKEGMRELSATFDGREYDTSHESWVRMFLLDLMGYARESKTTNLFSSEIPVDSPNSWSRYGFEEYMVDGIFLLYLEEDGHGYRRIMKMPKARGSKVSPAFYEFELGEGGIKVVKK